MEFNDWLMSNDIDPETLSAPARVKLQAQWRAEQNGGGTATATADEPTGAFDGQVRGIEAEAERVNAIMHATQEAMKPYARIGDKNKIAGLRALADSAIADPKVDFQKFQLALLRATRADAVVAFERPDSTPNAKVIEAAVCRMAGLDNIENHYDAATLEASDRHFRGGLGLQDLFAYSARRNGWRGSNVRGALQSQDFLRAAFADTSGDASAMYDFKAADTGPSTYSLPNILGNIANKFLRIGFENVDNAWSFLCSRRSVNDFKTITTAALTGSLLYRKLAPSGEIKAAGVGEVAYTNKADTYAVLLGIERTDLINDDLGALATAGRRVGRGAALKINDIFWTVFLNNSSFFTSGNANVISGGTSALASAGLKLIDQKFRVQTDPDGLPLGAMPAILLVPPTLLYTGRELMNSSFMVGNTTTDALKPSANIFQGAYRLVTSPYMENSTYTGNSTAAYYLLADPQDIPVIEGAFLNGKDTPTVETSEADFNHLGIAMRGFIDFGFSLQEFRGGVRSAGS